MLQRSEKEVVALEEKVGVVAARARSAPRVAGTAGCSWPPLSIPTPTNPLHPLAVLCCEQVEELEQQLQEHRQRLEEHKQRLGEQGTQLESARCCSGAWQAGGGGGVSCRFAAWLDQCLGAHHLDLG